MPADLTGQLSAALTARRSLLEQLHAEQTTAYRLFHGSVEGDTGLTVDRYGDTLLVQSFHRLLAPAELMPDFAKVIEYNTSCVPEFSQQGAIAALDAVIGEAAVSDTLAGLATSRRQLLDGLAALGSVEEDHLKSVKWLNCR